MSDDKILIAGASGFWGDAARSTPQLLATEGLDYLVYDYLAEITMSIMARARAKDDSKGYAIDFVTVAMAENLRQISDKGVKVISNAGGVNPQACAAALRTVISEQGLDLKVACIVGDDLLPKAQELAASGHSEMFRGDTFPDPERMLSINAYLGAFPIAQALDAGADIVITGRCVDSAVTLGACIHAFSWANDDWDKLAMGSLAGHILECGPQATGGNFTDWEQVADRIDEIGYPIAEVSPSGEFVCTKPPGTGGVVSLGTVAEQLLYEIGDPQAYLLPDVNCDFSEVSIIEEGADRVRVSGAKGRPAPSSYKVCSTFADQFRGGTMMTVYGIDADKKATALANAIFRASSRVFEAHGMPDFSETSVELIGAESQYGAFKEIQGSREVAMKIAVKHPLAAGIGVLLKEAVGVGLATPPGLSGFQGARPKPSPVVRLFSFTLPKAEVAIHLELDDGKTIEHRPHLNTEEAGTAAVNHSIPEASFAEGQATQEVPLIDLAWGRSGDKGNKANVGIIARKPQYFPYILAALSESDVEERFAHFLEKPNSVHRFLLPGISAVNFLMDSVLGGGGVASIRNDAQGKGYAQLLLQVPVTIPSDLLENV